MIDEQGRTSPRLTRGDVVVVFLFAVALFTVLLPIVALSRESSRRNTCKAKLRALALGCIDWEDRFGSYPPAIGVILGYSPPWISTGKENGLTHAGPNWATNIAAQMGRDDLSVELAECLESFEKDGYDFPWNAADDCSKVGRRLGAAHPIGVPDCMICPSASRPNSPHTSAETELEDLVKGNYAACMGAGTYFESIDEAYRYRPRDGTIRRIRRHGVMTVAVHNVYTDWYGETRFASKQRMSHGRGVVARRVTDGVRHTMLLSEVLAFDGTPRADGGSLDIRGVWVSPSMGASTYSHLTTPNSKTKDQINGCGDSSTCVQQVATGATAGDTFAAARSEHTGGVVGARCDGSVRFYSNDVNATVWAAMATRDGND